jgi:hypothetical protein
MSASLARLFHAKAYTSIFGAFRPLKIICQSIQWFRIAAQHAEKGRQALQASLVTEIIGGSPIAALRHEAI